MLPPHCPHPPGGYVNRARALSRCGGKLALEPGPGPPQALGQRDARSISEQALGPLEICERVTYVPLPSGQPLVGELPASNLPHQLDQVEQRRPRSCTYVHHRPAHRFPRPRCRKQGGVHHVAHVGEITCLRPVPEQSRLPLFQRSEQQSRNERGIRGVRTLPRTKHVEISERHPLHQAAASEGKHVLLTRQLGRRIGRAREGFHRFRLRQDGRVTVDGAGARVDNAPDLRRSARLEHAIPLCRWTWSPVKPPACVTARLRGVARLAPLAAHSRPTPVASHNSPQDMEIHYRVRDSIESWRACGVASVLCGVGAVPTVAALGCPPPRWRHLLLFKRQSITVRFPATLNVCTPSTPGHQLGPTLPISISSYRSG